MTELTPGLELGARFALIRRLGSGGTAEVWLADDSLRGERVALKIFFDRSDAGLALRLAVELARVRALGADWAVPILDVLQADGRSLVVMEYQAGGDLGQFRGRGYETWKQAADAVVAALAAAHAVNLVHRDLKCSNVLLDAAGRARLSDFGIAAQVGAPAAGGSPYNASPQQLRGEPATPSDDLYAFGAMLYELIAGHPPYYPEITRERVLYEPVPPLLPRGTVPVGVRELALRLLSKSPRERPTHVAEIRRRLLAPAGDAGDSIEAPELVAIAGAPHRHRRRLSTPILIGSAALAAVAIIWLPKFLADRDGGIVSEARDSAEAQSRDLKASLQRTADMAAQKAAAMEARGRFDAAFKALDVHAAANWATEKFATVREQGEQAAQRLAVGDYTAARQTWDAGTAQLAALEKERPRALAQALDRGKVALAQAKTADARDAFESALAIETGHAGAKAGIERAARLDQAFVIVDAAVAAERAGRLAEAEREFRRALALDAAVPGAAAGLARLAARKSGDAYAALMSRGLADLAAGRSEPARAALQQALAMRPDSREARDALASLEQGQRASALQLLEARAASAESDERWSEALAAWKEAADLEPGLASARDGIARSGARAELQQRIAALMQHQERLWDPAGRAEAHAVLAMASATANPRRQLAAAAADLERLAAAAEQPVRLRMESDGQTSIAIYRVGQYGTFSQREFELLPGRYTVVGTRTGFRDVRRDVILMPGATPAAVVVKCEEPI